MTKQENKNSAKKKLIPAVAMLTTSAVMLSTSTYAWFTMSREVEVNNIRMTATTPEDIQISLGKLAVTGTPGTAVDESGSADYSLGSSTGVLFANNGVAGDGNAAAPENSWDWSNSADISAYYDFGRLMPASSCDGQNIFFTPDASGVGKTVKTNASYYQAAEKLAAKNDSGTETNKTYKATLHALTNKRDATTEADNWATATSGGYTQAAAWNKTNDDGYYVDIPIWLRTSSNTAVKLSVDGYVLPANVSDTATGDTQSQLELYRAVRVAILDGETVVENDKTGAAACAAGDPAVASKSEGSYNNILPLKDAWSTDGNTLVSASSASADTKYKQDDLTALKAPFSSTSSILDSLNYKREQINAENTLYGVSGLGNSTTFTDGSSYIPATYKTYTALTPTSETSPDTVATVAGSTTSNDYGDAKKLIIRVWLDGEDGECWNDNAGQDWAISLKFSKIDNSTP